MNINARPLVTASATAILCLLPACGVSNNPALGQVQATLGRYEVTVTDCYNYGVPRVESLNGGNALKFSPCKDSVVTLQGNSLYVNGNSYGDLAEGDRIIVRHGQVTIIHRE